VVLPVNYNKNVIMDKSYKYSQRLQNLFSLKLLPIITLNAYCEPDKMSIIREIKPAVINISGRQRMLCQRSALLAVRLVLTQNSWERENLVEELLGAIELLEVSHQGLIQGNAEMKLPGQPSEAVLAIYFNEPVALDRQIQEYLVQLRTLASAARSFSCELTLENRHLQAILKAETSLNKALDTVVNQYQKEFEEALLNLEKQQVEGNYKSCAAAAAAYVYAQQREQTLQDLKSTQAQLIQTEKLSTIGQMVAGVAHEINNPISFIYGNLRYASDYVRDLVDLVNLYQQYYSDPVPTIKAKVKHIDLDFLLKDLPKVLQSMEIGADRVRQIVVSLRNFSRSDQVFLEAVNLHEGIDSTLLILQNRLKVRCNRPEIEVIKEYGSLPIFKCCPGQLNQVFMNIISNAIDAIDDIPEHQGYIRIQTSVNANYSGILIQIADNGSGITPEIKEQLFTPFFTTKPFGKGTGLGLSISRQIIVETHGGNLECESELGKGTHFKIEIPLQQSDQEPLLLTNHSSKAELSQTSVCICASQV
jgi:two-component system, NtrC family, sensor kinase